MESSADLFSKTGLLMARPFKAVAGQYKTQMNVWWAVMDLRVAELREETDRLEKEIAALESRLEEKVRQPFAIPSLAESVISYVCAPDRLEAVLGDLQRNSCRYASKHGAKAARRWYWWQTVRTFAAFGFQTLARLVLAHELLKRLGL